jgi:hypothetical protein
MDREPTALAELAEIELHSFLTAASQGSSPTRRQRDDGYAGHRAAG